MKFLTFKCNDTDIIEEAERLKTLGEERGFEYHDHPWKDFLERVFQRAQEYAEIRERQQIYKCKHCSQPSDENLVAGAVRSVLSDLRVPDGPAREMQK